MYSTIKKIDKVIRRNFMYHILLKVLNSWSSNLKWPGRLSRVEVPKWAKFIILLVKPMTLSNYVYRFSFSDLQDVASKTHQNCFDKLKEAFTAISRWIIAYTTIIGADNLISIFFLSPRLVVNLIMGEYQ